MSIAVAVNKIMTDAEKEEIKNLVLSAAGVDYSRGDVISVSGLQFEGVTKDKKSDIELEKQYQQERIVDVVVTSVLPLIVVLVLGLFALLVIRNFISRIPVRNIEKRIPPEEIPTRQAELEESMEALPKLDFSRREVSTQKEQSINEINDAVMASPEDAAKLLTSFIKE